MPMCAQFLGRLLGFLYTRCSVARWVSTPRGRKSPASPLVSTSCFAPCEPAPSLLPFGIRRPPSSEFTDGDVPVRIFTLRASYRPSRYTPHPFVTAPQATTDHAWVYRHIVLS
jgi:hypothetical protein